VLSTWFNSKLLTFNFLCCFLLLVMPNTLKQIYSMLKLSLLAENHRLAMWCLALLVLLLENLPQTNKLGYPVILIGMLGTQFSNIINIYKKYWGSQDTALMNTTIDNVCIEMYAINMHKLVSCSVYSFWASPELYV